MISRIGHGAHEKLFATYGMLQLSPHLTNFYALDKTAFKSGSIIGTHAVTGPKYEYWPV